MKKRILIFCLVLFGFINYCNFVVANTRLANPWVDCNDDLIRASKVSGITFPLRLSNYWVRAMDGMIEISYPFDEFRHVTVRKTEKYISDDISGVYVKYPRNKQMKFTKDMPVKIRAKWNKIYVMNWVTSTGYYSAYCEQGMSLKEAKGVYEVVRENEGYVFK